MTAVKQVVFFFFFCINLTFLLSVAIGPVCSIASSDFLSDFWEYPTFMRFKKHKYRFKNTYFGFLSIVNVQYNTSVAAVWPDSLGLVDFVIGLTNFVKLSFLRNLNYRTTAKSILLIKMFLGLVEMTFVLINAIASACAMPNGASCKTADFLCTLTRRYFHQMTALETVNHTAWHMIFAQKSPFGCFWGATVVFSAAVGSK